MIIKNIFKIHFLYYVTLFVGAITGNFKEIIIFSSIIIIHELGHLLGAFIFKWNIEKVILLPFGGITIFNERIDKPLYQEIIIASLGPIFQLIFYLIYQGNYLFDYYNKLIFIFNLLPIVPLDGSKILNVFFNKCFSYKLSHKLSILISIIILLGLLKIKNILFYLILIFIFIEIIREIKKHKYYFNKFILEKYLYNDRYKREKIITSLKDMKKQTNHFIIHKNKIYLEKEYLNKLYR